MDTVQLEAGDQRGHLADMGGGSVVKQCNHCRTLKPVGDFARNRAAKDGLQNACKPCGREANQKSYYRHKDKVKSRYLANRETRLAQMKRNRLEKLEAHRVTSKRYTCSHNGRVKTLHGRARRRALKLGLDFDLTVDFIDRKVAFGHCERTGIPFDLSIHPTNQINPFSPSVDRIDCRQGYIQSNVQVVCSAYNIGKNQMSDEEYIAFCKIVVERCK